MREPTDYDLDDDESDLAEDLADYLTPDGRIDLKKVIANAEPLDIPDKLSPVESLRGKYALPRPDISEDDLNDYLRQIGREWESELDDLGSDN